MCGEEHRSGAAQLAQLAVDERGALGVEAGIGLVQQQQVRVVEERAAERQPLHHPTREVGHPCAPLVPEAEALEQHPDPLAPFGHAVEATVELEVLERRQLAVEPRVVAEKADRRSRRVDVERARGRRRESGAEPQQGRLAGAVRPRHEQEAAALDLQVETLEHAPRAVPLRELGRPDHGARIVPLQVMRPAPGCEKQAWLGRRDSRTRRRTGATEDNARRRFAAARVMVRIA